VKKGAMPPSRVWNDWGFHDSIRPIKTKNPSMNEHPKTSGHMEIMRNHKIVLLETLLPIESHGAI